MRIETTESVTDASTTPAGRRPEAEAPALLGQIFPGRCRDGIPEGPKLDELVRDFQELRGLEPHGRLDGDTMDALRRAADWARHEARGRQEAEAPGPPRAGPERASVDTRAALLAKSLQEKAGDARAAAGREVFELEPRPVDGAQRVGLSAFVGEIAFLVGLRELAMEQDRTVVVGPGVAGAAFVRAFGGGGIYFGPDGEVGLTTSGGFGMSTQPAGVSATMQIMILDGGLELLEGRFVMAGVSAGQTVVGGACVVLDEETREPVGMAFEAGVALGTAPFEGYYQGGWGTVTGSDDDG